MKNKFKTLLTLITLILVIVVSSPYIKEEREVTKIIQSFKDSPHYHCIIANEENIRGNIKRKITSKDIKNKFLKACKNRVGNQPANISWRHNE